MYKLKFMSRTEKEEGLEKVKCNRETAVVLLKGEIVDKKFVGEEVGSAAVARHYTDPDVPVLGQKYAVEKLIKEGKYSREERKEIWDTFWNYSQKADSLRHGAYKEEQNRVKSSAWFRRLFKKANRIG